MLINKLKGTGVALVTPFNKKGEIDYHAFEKVINHVIAGGVNYLVLFGTTGESVTLSPEEKKEGLAFAKKINAARVAMVVGVGGNNTSYLVHELQTLNTDSVDAILSVSPYYNKPTQEGIYQHYMKLAEVSPQPIIIYNVPGRTSSNISAETTLRLANASEKFVAVKEASLNLHQCAMIIKHRPKNFLVLSGDDNLTLPLLSLGAEGVISVIANAIPKPFTEMVNAALSRDFKSASLLHLKMLELFDLMMAEGNPGGVKAALSILRICENELRLPLVKVGEKTYSAIKEELKLF